jgi:hypothetical protein
MIEEAREEAIHKIEDLEANFNNEREESEAMIHE